MLGGRWVRITAEAVPALAKAANQAIKARNPGTRKVSRVSGTTKRNRLKIIPPVKSTVRAGQGLTWARFAAHWLVVSTRERAELGVEGNP